MTTPLISFDELAGEILACGARVVVSREGASFEPSEWSLVKNERGYSHYRRESAVGTAVLIASDGAPPMLSLSCAMPGDELGWEGWTEESERARQRANDAATIVAFGAVEKAFDWGTVQSGYCDRDGSASIWVTFRKQPLWERLVRRVRGRGNPCTNR